MEFLRLALLFIHLIGMATLVSAFVLQLRTASDGPLVSLWRHGAELQFVTGIALVGLHHAIDDIEPNDIKAGVKLLVVLAILVLAFRYSARRKDQIPSWLPMAMGGLVALNVGVAVFWT